MLVKEWKYVPSKLNPEDFGTKWFTDQGTIPELWIKGSSFLKHSEIEWPAEPTNLPPIEEEERELRCNVNLAHDGSSNCVKFERFSNFNRLVRTQAQY